MYIKQHIKSLPTLKHHKGSDYDVEEMRAPHQNGAARIRGIG